MFVLLLLFCWVLLVFVFFVVVFVLVLLCFCFCFFFFLSFFSFLCGVFVCFLNRMSLEKLRILGDISSFCFQFTFIMKIIKLHTYLLCFEIYKYKITIIYFL